METQWQFCSLTLEGNALNEPFKRAKLNIPTRDTERLRLRSLTEDDAHPLFDAMNDVDVMQYFPSTRLPTFEQVGRMIERQNGHWKKFGYGWWAVVEAESKRVIGWCGLQYLPDSAEIEVAYLLGKAYWGYGYATEAALEATRFAFEDLELPSLVGITHRSNKASQRVIEKLGGANRVEAVYFGMESYRYLIKSKVAGPSKGFYERALRQAKYGESLEHLESEVETSGEAYRNLLYETARIEAMTGNRVKAYDLLHRASAAGFWDVRRLSTDPAFAQLRDDSSFKQIIRAAWATGYISMLEREERSRVQMPDKVMAALEIREGSLVAEIGAGSGYFTTRLAEVVGPTGKVLALDTSQEMLDYLDKRLTIEGIDNVTLKRAKRDDPELTKCDFDLIVLIDVLHYMENRVEYMAKLKNGLGRRGKVAIIDYIPRSWEDRPWGPPPQQQIARETIDREMQEAGFVPSSAHLFLPEQYFVIYERASVMSRTAVNAQAITTSRWIENIGTSTQPMK